MKWFYDLKIGAKLIISFVTVAVIAGIIGMVGISNLNKIKDADSKLYTHMTVPIGQLSDIATAYQRIRVNLRDMILADGGADAQTYVDKARDIDSQLMSLAAEYEKTLISDANKEAFKDFKEADDNYEPILNHICELAIADKDKEAIAYMRENLPLAKAEQAAIDKMQELKIAAAKQTANDNAALAKKAVTSMITLLCIGVAMALGLGMFIAKMIGNPVGQMVDAAVKISAGDIDQSINFHSKDEIGTLADAFRGLIDYIKGIAAAADAISKGDLTANVTARSERDLLSKNMIRAMESLRSLIEDDGGAALLAAANRDLTARVKRDYDGAYGKMKENINTLLQNLDEGIAQVAVGAEQVASASGQISAGSEALAQGASEQASALEEVSSSLQEMGSMTKQNAANAKEARSMTDAARVTADAGVDSMRRLSEAIDRIKASSDETAKIVKTIDEIAFQTNLLALNAAVEAARAGDAGKGFAVVAEEVRNLAMRSAEAAKNTANMIEESVNNAEGGVNINQEVMKNLQEINLQVNKVTEVMAEIAAASDQQTQGIEQINVAVGQMDQVTQQNAANSEESASAAEELSGQAEEMRNMVASFKLSAVTARTPAAPRVSAVPPPARKKQEKELVGAGTGKKNGHGSKVSQSAESLIPFDDNDTLQEF